MTKREINCPECGAVVGADIFAADAARRRYFAIIREAWNNLREPWAAQFPSPEHLRKYCLIKAGWCDTTMVAVGSKSGAIAVAAMVHRLDDHAIAVPEGTVVTVYKARSQTRRAQRKAQFMETAQAVYRILEEMLGVSTEDLARVA